MNTTFLADVAYRAWKLSQTCTAAEIHRDYINTGRATQMSPGELFQLLDDRSAFWMEAVTRELRLGRPVVLKALGIELPLPPSRPTPPALADKTQIPFIEKSPVQTEPKPWREPLWEWDGEKLCEFV